MDKSERGPCFNFWFFFFFFFWIRLWCATYLLKKLNYTIWCVCVSIYIYFSQSCFVMLMGLFWLYNSTTYPSCEGFKKWKIFKWQEKANGSCLIVISRFYSCVNIHMPWCSTWDQGIFLISAFAIVIISSS